MSNLSILRACIDRPTNNKNNIGQLKYIAISHVPRQKPEIIPQKCKNSKLPQKHEKLLRPPPPLEKKNSRDHKHLVN